jgi:uncharacterized protein
MSAGKPMPENRGVRDDPRFRRGVGLFDEGEFFEAHEEWEALWHETRGAARDFIQGLIQVTSAMHHLRNGNMRGARELHDSGLRLLAPYGGDFEGVDLKTLRLHFDRALAEILHEPYERLAGRSAPSAPVKIAYSPDRAFKFPFASTKTAR